VLNLRQCQSVHRACSNLRWPDKLMVTPQRTLQQILHAHRQTHEVMCKRLLSLRTRNDLITASLVAVYLPSEPLR